jgi:hypothetical protein
VDGGCEAPRTPCNGACVNLTCDPENCASCGRSCGGGACGNNRCGVATLAQKESGPWGLALGSGEIYWTDKSSAKVRVMPLDGGPAANVAVNEALAQGIAVNATHVYWTDAMSSNVQMSSTTSFQPMSFAPAAHPAYVAATSTMVYWTNQANVGDAGPCLQIAALDGGIAITHGSGGPGPSDIALNSTDVYWTTANGIWSAAANATPGAAHQFAADAAGPISLAVTDKQVFWGNGSGIVQSQSIPPGPTPVQLDITGAKPTGMAVDAKYVYWVDQTAGLVQRAPLNATGPSSTTTLVSNQNQPVRIAVDDNFVYWTNFAAGTVSRLAK